MTPVVPAAPIVVFGRSTTFTVLTLATVVMMATASGPSPLCPLYRERWDFSDTMVTVVFAVYVVGLLGALLTVGSLSDRLGRRPVLITAAPAGGGRYRRLLDGRRRPVPGRRAGAARCRHRNGHERSGPGRSSPLPRAPR